MKPALEKLIFPDGSSFRCFDRSTLKTEIKWHRHPEFEINFVAKGSGTRMVGDHVGEFSNGDLVLLGPDLPHTWLSDDYVGKRFDRHSSIVVQFLPEVIGAAFFELPELSGVKRLLKRSEQGLWFRGKRARKIGDMMTSMVQCAGAERVIGLLHCLNELVKIRDSVQLATLTYSTSLDKNVDVRIQVVCQYINTHLTNSELDLGCVPGLVKMNPSAFSRFFKKTTGRTLTCYVNELRIGLACRKLVDSDENILSISMEAGFGSLSNFNRRFRETKGMTPRQFREKMKIAV